MLTRYIRLWNIPLWFILKLNLRPVSARPFIFFLLKDFFRYEMDGSRACRGAEV